MNIQKVSIVNKSSNINLKISLKSPEDATDPSPSESIPIDSGQQKNLAWQPATANLFVWSENELIWKGIIPTKVQHPIEIYPEEKKVSFDGMVLPDNFKPTIELKKSSSQNTSSIWVYFLIFALIAIIIIGYLLRSGKITL